MLNAEALLKNDELFEEVMTQFCHVMECSLCPFKEHDMQCNLNAASYRIPWCEWKTKEVKPFE